MKAASKPDSTAFDPVRLIEDHQAGVWRYLRALGCEANLAEDLTQETFLAVLQRPFEDYNTAATAAYLRRTAYNALVSFQRRAKKVATTENIDELSQNWENWGGNDNGEELLDALRRCLAVLSERARLALELRFGERASREVIAKRLEMSEHGAKNLMQRAKRTLRDCIESKLQ
ncbi:MAG: sigma-70 family RNA polymerase sigma factor [Planctomycetaceae bacterium]|nr:sigma-70 family RNA polymerase sigma factor [Planctomycetales bacterium]MCB9923656.1 sigma-70 family RNA polymerase sigma factor [Planctomycetaceae bacterium]